MTLACVVALAVAALVAGAGLVGAGVAAAHPLGNFSVNHLTVVSVSQDRVDVRYILDQAEIPTFQERDRNRDSILSAKRGEVTEKLSLRVDGRSVALQAVRGARLSFPPGQGGLKTTRMELDLVARVDKPRRVELTDGTFADRLGWKDVVTRPGEGTHVRSSVPASEPTRGLRSYPEGLLDSPADRRSASLSVGEGEGTVIAPRVRGAGLVTTDGRGEGGFSEIFDDAAAGEGVLWFLLLAAFGWGALHALSPGHGKTMVAAYLVGTRGTARQAIALGATVTVTHTMGVFALALVALLLSAYVLPEDLYPWLNLVAGLLVIGVGAGVLIARLRGRAAGHSHHSHPHHHHSHPHTHEHEHEHEHEHGHPLEPARSASGTLTPRGLVALGASAGLIPCPSALVVLLGAVAQHEVALGLLLVLAFSFGLAGTLTALGLAVVWTSGLSARLPRSGFVAVVAGALPAMSALVIIVAGALLTAQAVPQLL